jgi:hypothetical protein
MSKRYCVGRVIVSRAARSGRLAVVAGVVAAGLWSTGTAGTAWGQTWNGASTTSNNWSAGGTGGNWTGAAAPVNNGTANVFFGGTARLTPNQDAAWNINSLTFNTAPAAFTLGGSTLTVEGGGITNSGSLAETINNSVVLGASQVWGGSGPINFGATGTPTLSLGANTLTIAATGNYTISNAISGSASTALVLNSYQVTLGGSASNTFSGAVNVNGGTLTLSKTGSSVAIPGNLNIGDGAGAAGSAVVSLQAGNQIATTSNLVIQTDGQLSQNGNYVTVNNLTMTGGTIAIGAGGFTVTGAINIGASSTGSVITAADDNSDFNLSGTRTFNVAAGGGSYDLDLIGTGNGVGLFDGTLIKTGNGVMRIGGPNTNVLTGVTLQQGTLAVAGGGGALGAATSTLTLAGGVLQPDTAGTDPGTLSVKGTVSLTGNTRLGADANGDDISFYGPTNVAGARTLTLSTPYPGTGDYIPYEYYNGINAGGAGNSLTFVGTSPTWVYLGGGTVSGSITVGNNVTLIEDASTIAGSVTNSPGGNFAYGPGIFSGVPGTFPGTLDNQGTISFTYGLSLDVGGGMTNQAPLTLPTGYSVTAEGLGLNNQSPITLSGGYVGGGGPFVNYSTVSGFGTIGGAGTFANYGYLYNSGGALTFAEAGGATNYGNFYVYSVSAGSAIQIASGMSLTNSGSMTLGPGVVISGPGGFTNSAGGTLGGAALITAPFYNGPGGLVTESSGALAITTPFTNAGSIYLAGVTASITGGAIANTGSIEGFGTVGSAVSNTAGTIEAIGGILNLYGGLTNGAGGTIAVDAGTKTLVSPGLAVNAG